MTGDSFETPESPFFREVASSHVVPHNGIRMAEADNGLDARGFGILSQVPCRKSTEPKF